MEAWRNSSLHAVPTHPNATVPFKLTILDRLISLISCVEKIFPRYNPSRPGAMHNVTGGRTNYQRAAAAAADRDDHDFTTYTYSDKDQEEFEESSESLFHTVLILATFSVVVILLVIRSTRGGYCAACQVPATLEDPGDPAVRSGEPRMTAVDTLGLSHLLGHEESEAAALALGMGRGPSPLPVKRQSLVVWVDETSTTADAMAGSSRRESAAMARLTLPGVEHA